MGAMPDSLFFIVIFAFYSVVVIGGITAFLIYDHKQKKKAAAATIKIEDLIKKLKGAETELLFLTQTQKSQNLYGAAIHGLGDGVVIVDKNGAIGVLNPAVESITGIASLDMKDEHYGKIFHFVTEKDEEIPSPFEKALLGETAHITKWTFLKTKTGKVPIDASIIPLRAGGELIGALFVFRDASSAFEKEKEVRITNEGLMRERDAARKELESVKKLTDLARNIISSVTHGLMILDGTGHVAYFNPYAEHFTGKYQGDVAGKQYRDILYFTDRDGKPKDAAIEAALKGQSKKLEQWTFLNTHASGKTPISGSVTPMQKDGIPVGVVIEFADASAEYQEAEDDKAFFSAAAHDLRSPLSAIRSMVELLVSSVETEPKEKVQELVANTNDAVLQLIALVNDLLNVSRIEQGRIVVTKEPFDIVDVTRDVAVGQEVIAHGKKLYLTHEEPDQKPPRVIGDKNKTRDVLTNLIANAIKYTHQGGITVTHGVEGMNLVTRVTDTGTGISPDDAGLLFRKFQQVGSARGQTIAKSTGLGLYIAKKFAQLMDGDITLEKSEPGKGSTFTFALPVEITPEPAPAD